MREIEIEQYLVERVEALGGQALKFTSLARRGVPDRLVILPGRHMEFVELKAPGKRLRPDQNRFAQKMWNLKHKVRCIDSIEGVDEYLRARMREREWRWFTDV
jgi:hypothetical protein